LYSWDLAVRAFVALEAFREQHGLSLSPGNDIPEEYGQMVHEFATYVECSMITVPTSLLKRRVSSSPQLRKHLSSTRTDIGWQVSRRDGRTTNDSLLWLLGCIMADDDFSMLGVDNILDELEQLTRSDPKRRQRI
jgi:hypothetical protein